MATYVFVTFALGSMLVIVLWVIGNALSEYWRSSRSNEHIDYAAHRVRRQPVPQKRVQPSVGLRPTAPRETERQIGIEKKRVIIPTVQSSPRTNQTEAEVEEIMEAADRFLGLDEISNEEKEALTTHQRGYYAHYYAAKFQLSQGNINGFRGELKRAGHELAEMEEILINYRPSLQNQVLGHSFA